jgi:hypothetical protein
LYIAPTERLGGEEVGAVVTIEIVPETFQVELFLALELRIESRLIHSGGMFELRQTRSGESLFPKYRQGLPEHVTSGEFLGSSHGPNIVGRLKNFNTVRAC